MTAAIAACAVLLAVPAAAVDGEILIDQAKVNAGGITPGDAPGFPATLSRPGRYKLTGNLAVPADLLAIEVTQDSVTIDLNGFTIASNPPGEAHDAVLALSLSGLRGLRVMNGTIAHFRFYGIHNGAGAFAVIENMRIVSTGTGILAEADSQIRDSTIVDGGVGIICRNRCLIERSVISGNTGNGVNASGGATLLGNAIVDNGGYGLLAGAVSVGYGDNILSGNDAGGIGIQVLGPALQLHPNACEPACP